MRRAAIACLWSHWARHPLQLVTLLAGLALATGLWSAVQAINAEARTSYAEASAQLGVGQFDELRAASGPIPLARYVALRRAGWQLAALLEGQLRLPGGSVDVMGVDLLSYPALPAVEETSQEDGIAPTDALLAPGLLIAGPETAERLESQPGLPPVRRTQNLPSGVVLTDIGTAEMLLNRRAEITRLLILPDQSAGLTPLADLAPDLMLVRAEGRSELARLTDSFHLNLTAFGLLSFAVGLFIVHGMVGLSFEQRRGMIRTLRALGLPLRDLTWLMLGELLLFALIGGLIGLVLGYGVAAALLPDVAATLRGLYGAPVDGDLALQPAWVALGLMMAVAGTFAASAQALWHLSRVPILQAQGQYAWTAQGLPARAQAGFGALLICAGFLALVVFDGLIAGFAMLGGLLMGAALLLPPILSLALRLGERFARGPLEEWIWADMRAQLPGLSLALMALLLALAANIGVGTMVSSFRLTFTGWLDQRLASELYVTARDEAQGHEIERWLNSRADAVLPIRATEVQVAGETVFLYGIIDHPTYRNNWPLIAELPEVWDVLAEGRGALINEQMARRMDLWPGDRVELLPGWSLPVAGVYSDYGNPTGQAITALPALLERVPDLPNTRFGIRIDPPEAEDLRTALADRFALPPQAVVPQAAIKASSLAIFEKTFVVTGALNILTLGVAGFAILTSLLTLWAHRLPQLAPVWALGVQRDTLARLEVLRSVALAVMTAVLALPLGLVLAWALLAIINVEAFGWRLPMHLFPLQWLVLLLLAVATAILAALLPARRLRHLPPSDLLQVFANAR
ncbi:ABC transporter permease [Ruegeria sp. 2205SS24-7]|uniref:ABC transporter permease n=1 Tax=Ruegeria discodermiae TaxID=3064389 RepID=UPI00274110CE|nr:ABC transporter permease [Ruegeria sp. 2205SS24-7]MDP5216230.1 ABC transporter permease [Ruegeria sp. 2205SS24-7]